MLNVAPLHQHVCSLTRCTSTLMVELLMVADVHALRLSCLQRHIAMVVVGFPATALLMSRCRVCISASHSREDLDYALEVSGPHLRRLQAAEHQPSTSEPLSIYSCVRFKNIHAIRL